MVKILLTACISIYILLFAATISANNHVGISFGSGKPQHMHGSRINFQRKLLNWPLAELRIDVSYAHWQTRSPRKNLDILSIAPWLQIGNNSFPFFHASIGIAHKSSKLVGNNMSGSKWAFQDIIGIGFNLTKNLSCSLNYLHYSNAKLAKPNPGIEILPLILVTYKF